MKLSDEAKQELIELCRSSDFKQLKKVIFADNPGSKEATDQFTDFIQFFHKMASHPLREPKPIKGIFLL